MLFISSPPEDFDGFCSFCLYIFVSSLKIFFHAFVVNFSLLFCSVGGLKTAACRIAVAATRRRSEWGLGQGHSEYAGGVHPALLA